MANQMPNGPKKEEAPAHKRPSIWDNQAFLLALAALGALVLWNLVTLVFDPSANITLTGAVNYNYGTSAYAAQGLSVVETEDAGDVRIRLEGNGTAIGGIRDADYVIYPDYSTVKGPGAARLKLQVRITNNAFSGVRATVVGPQYVNVVFDTVGEKTIPVQVESSGLQVAEGYVLNRTAAVPAEVTLSGPVGELEKINGVFAVVNDLEDELTDSRTQTAMLELRDENGNPYTPEYLSLDTDAVSVTFTVHQVRELPLVVDFIDTPSNFDTSSLKYTLSQEKMTVQGPAKAVSALTELSVASFDLGQSFAFDRDYPLPVELPAGLESQDGLTTVTLSFDTDGMASKTLNVSNIKCINVPMNCDVDPLTEQVQGVVLYGPKEEIEALSAESVVAQIDCQSISVSTGQQTMPVSIQIPASTRIFATGSYTVQCQVTSK